MQKIVVFLVLFTAFILYSFLVYTTGTKTVQPEMNEQAARGKTDYLKYNCNACHQLYGLGGYLGPELNTVMSQKGKGEAYAKSFLRSGSQRMPDFHLKEDEINDLVEFLNYVAVNTQLN